MRSPPSSLPTLIPLLLHSLYLTHYLAETSRVLLDFPFSPTLKLIPINQSIKRSSNQPLEEKHHETQELRWMGQRGEREKGGSKK